MSGRFQIVYADPPWRYQNRGDKLGSNNYRAADVHYPTMALERICALPVAKLAAPDAVLFLWGTYALTPEALTVISAWGFEFKTLAFDWVKTTKTGKEHFGLGHWTRGNSEPCWLATRGDPPRRVSAAVRQLVLTEGEVIAAEKREHSRKPDEVRNRIVELMGDLPRIELFARARVEGWHSWGNELPRAA